MSYVIAIILMVIVGLAVVFGVGALIYWCVHKKNKKAKASSSNPASTAATPVFYRSQYTPINVFEMDRHHNY